MPHDRLGPPNPRNEPWRQPVPPLPEQPGRLPVPARDARDKACRAFIRQARYDNRYNSVVIAAIKDGFAAGWNAALAVEPVPDKLDTGSLFPTMGLAHDC